jgi:hypothetical protein
MYRIGGIALQAGFAKRFFLSHPSNTAHPNNPSSMPSKKFVLLTVIKLLCSRTDPSLRRMANGSSAQEIRVVTSKSSQNLFIT